MEIGRFLGVLLRQICATEVQVLANILQMRAFEFGFGKKVKVNVKFFCLFFRDHKSKAKCGGAYQVRVKNGERYDPIVLEMR